MKHCIYILLISVLFVCCNSTKKDELDVSISRETMAYIIKDLNKAYYMVVSSETDSLNREKMKKDYKETICSHYNTTAETYEHDLQEYIKHPDIMQEILENTKK